MVANGDTEVNVVRAEHCSSVKVAPATAGRTSLLRTENSAPSLLAAVPAAQRKPPSLRKPADATVSVFVQLSEENEAGGLDAALTAARGTVATAELPIEDALALAEQPQVAHIELGQPLTLPRPVVQEDRVRAPRPTLRRFGNRASHRFGTDVLIGVIDVGGFDFAHPDFLDQEGRTRFVRIWDQGGTTHASPHAQGTAPFDYGAELTQLDLNGAIAAARERGLPATELEPQSTMDPGSHATHVTSIAAGNRGVCREAAIAAVLISIPDDDLERRSSFYDSTRIAHAVDYLLAVADQLERPIAINISLGTNGHAHDDSAPVNRWIDAALTRPGRCVCVAAGNAGQERAQHADDIGWVMGRVHAAGQVRARELVSDVEWTVVGNAISDLSENELEIWYGPQDRFSVQVRPPGGEWTAPVRAGEFIENRQLPDGSFLSIYNELYHPANGANLIAIYLSPRLKDPLVGVSAGEWLVRLHGDDIRDGRYHCWIERDDPRPLGRLGTRETWAFPSFFSEASFIDRSTVSTLACGQRVVSVSNLDMDGRRINITSSQGPTRDEREKPDIAAPGSGIVAAKGFTGPDDRWVSMTGTSMASPFISGLAGLMLATNPALTAAQIGGILRRTARPLPASDFSWRDDAGAGAVDPGRCVTEAAAVGKRDEIR
jgi:subtilisin family serine protease